MLISISILTAITLTSVTSLVIPVFAKNKHGDKSARTCHFKTTQEDESYTDSNIIDEDSDLDGYQTEPDNSTLSIASQGADQFSPIGV